MRKRIVAVCLLALALLGACDYHELDNTVFAVGMGIERTGDGDYLIGVEIIAMEKGGQEFYDPQVAVASGKTLLEATSNVRGLISQKLDFSHCKVILFDQAVALEGIKPIVDAMQQFNEIDISTLSMVTVGCSPIEVLSTEPLTTRAQSFELRSTVVDEMGVEKAMRSSLLWLYNSIHEAESLAVLPRVIVRAVGQKSAVDIDGSVVLYRGQMRGEFDRQESLFFLLGEDTPHNRMISVPYGGEYFSAQIEASRSEIQPEVIAEGVAVRIRLHTRINYIVDYPEGVPLEALSGAIEAYISGGIGEAVEKARDEMGCDLYKIAMMLYRKYPGARADATAWREDVRAARYDIAVTLDIQTDEMIEGGR